MVSQKEEAIKQNLKLHLQKQVYNLDASTGAPSLGVPSVDPPFKTVLDAFLHVQLNIFTAHTQKFHSIFSQICDKRTCKLTHSHFQQLLSRLPFTRPMLEDVRARFHDYVGVDRASRRELTYTECFNLIIGVRNKEKIEENDSAESASDAENKEGLSIF